MQKAEIREKLLAVRVSQAAAQKQKKDRAIMRRLAVFPPFRQAKEFFSYITHNGEVSTDALLKKYFEKKKIIVPKVNGREICLYELHNASEFKEGKFGIREPKFCLPLGASEASAKQLLRPHRAKPFSELKKIEVALIPAVAFDETGHRIGYGGGYFDRLLKKVDCTTIGLAYELQIIDKVPFKHYDVPVDYIITEKRIINCHVTHERNPKTG